MNRKRPFGSSGVLAALLIAPRSFAYCVCMGCLRDLFYTYPGEECPHCGAAVTPECYVEGEMPGADGHQIDFRAEAHQPRRREGAALSHASHRERRNGVRRRSGKRRPASTMHAGAAG